MGSRHRALLITTGGGGRLHDMEKSKHAKELNDFLRSQGVSEENRGASLAHFDIGYDNGYSGEVPYYNDDWDRSI